jgi:hypothetical protein
MRGLHKNNAWDLFKLADGKRWLDANVCLLTCGISLNCVIEKRRLDANRRLPLSIRPTVLWKDTRPDCCKRFYTNL